MIDPYQGARDWILVARLGGDITARDAAARLSAVNKMEAAFKPCPEIREAPRCERPETCGGPWGQPDCAPCVAYAESDVLSESSERFCVACGARDHHVEACEGRPEAGMVRVQRDGRWVWTRLKDERGGEFTVDELLAPARWMLERINRVFAR